MRYHFHRDFFRLLHQSDDSKATWGKLANTFEKMWELCLRKAHPDDLEEHLPFAKDLTPSQLGILWEGWGREQRVSFLGELALTLEAEAIGDQKRGRTLLARMLLHTVALLRNHFQELDT